MGMCSNSDRSPYSSESAAAARRRSNKPLMEKRRRERINKCLSELQALLVDTAKTEHAHSKLEKADILEMTVKHIRSLKRMALAGGAVAESTDQASKYRAGYVECAARVSQYLASAPVDEQLRQRMMSHLMSCPSSAAGSSAAPAAGSSAAQQPQALNVQIPTPPTSPLAAAAAAAAAAASASSASSLSSSRRSPCQGGSSASSLPGGVVSVPGGPLAAVLMPSAAAVAAAVAADGAGYMRALGFAPGAAAAAAAAAHAAVASGYGLALPVDRKPMHPDEAAAVAAGLVWRPWSRDHLA